MFYAGVSLGSASNCLPPAPPSPCPLFYRLCPLRTCVCQATGPPPRSGEKKSLSPDGYALSLPQTAFSDFLMGSSKDLAKHIRVVVSGPSWQAEWVGPAEAALARVYTLHPPLCLPAV